MGIRITWTANTEADINSYELERSDDGIVFTALVTITHDLGDPLVYDVTNRVFFYLDTTGLQNFHFYRIRAVDDASNKSAYSTPKQVGPPEPPLCVVFGVVIDADGTPNTDVSVKGTIVSTKDTKDGQIVDSFGITNKAIEAFTDDNGFFEISLLQGASVILNIPTIELNREIAVPAQATVDFQDLL